MPSRVVKWLPLTLSLTILGATGAFGLWSKSKLAWHIDESRTAFDDLVEIVDDEVGAGWFDMSPVQISMD
jgi:hypothetical protein